jgi:hypothetical protein
MNTIFSFASSASAYTGMQHWSLDPLAGPRSFRGVSAWLDDVIIKVETPNAEGLNMGLVDFTPTRWKRFAEHYIDRERFQEFMDRLPNLRPQQTAGYLTPVRAVHSMGNCLMGFTARQRKKGFPELQMYSRTAIWAPTGVLDLYLGSLVANWWSRRIGFPVKLEWRLAQCQFTTWKSLAYLVNLIHMEARDRGVPIEQTWWLQQLTCTESSDNRYLLAMRKVYDQARHIHLHMDRTYRLPARQTNRMLAAERRFLAGYQRDLRPSIDTILDPDAMESLAVAAGVEDDEDNDED